MNPPLPAPHRSRPSRGNARGGLLAGLRAGDLAARLAIASFLWGMLLGPALHLANHRNDHHHGPGGLVHDHGDGRGHSHAPTGGDDLLGGARGAFDSAAAHHGDVATGGQGAPTTPAGSHGTGDALHFGLAWLDGAAPALTLGPHPAPGSPVHSPTGIGRLRRERGAVLARGPPASASAIDSIRG